MGNCLFKKKTSYCERLEVELYYLQKENLRSNDNIIRELQTLKKMLPVSTNDNINIVKSSPLRKKQPRPYSMYV